MGLAQNVRTPARSLSLIATADRLGNDEQNAEKISDFAAMCV
jgi:hypothetical protein